MSIKFNHVGLSVSDIESEVAFYKEAFDLQEEFRFSIEDEGISAAVLRSDEGWGIEILERADSHDREKYLTPNTNLKTRGYGHLCLQVNDIHALYEKLISLGASSITPPGTGPHPEILFCYVADPEGHFIELLEIPEGVTL